MEPVGTQAASPDAPASSQPSSLDVASANAAARYDSQGQQGQAQPASPPAQEAQAPVEPQAAYVWNLDGREYPLDKEAVEALLDEGLRAIQGRQAQQQAGIVESVARTEPQQQARPQAQPAPQGQEGFSEELSQKIAALEHRLNTAESRAMMQETISSAQKAVEKNETLNALQGDDRVFWQGMVMYVKGLRPELSWDRAAGFIAKRFGATSTAAKREFVESKLKAAETAIEGRGGGTPAPVPKRLGRADIFNGNLVARATQRMQQFMAGRKE